jgi:hypothetical protein
VPCNSILEQKYDHFIVSKLENKSFLIQNLDLNNFNLEVIDICGKSVGFSCITNLNNSCVLHLNTELSGIYILKIKSDSGDEVYKKLIQ